MLTDDVDAIRRILALQDGLTILIGHSWAGTVISEAGNDPKVAGLVKAGGFAQLNDEAFLRDCAAKNINLFISHLST